MRRLAFLLLLAISFGSLAIPVAAQPDPPPSRLEPLAVASGAHAGPAAADGARLAFRHTIRIPDARWLRLRFDHVELGEGSYLRLTSLEDGARQHLDAEAVEAWRLLSAYFNGDAVLVELFVAPGDPGASVVLAEAEVGLPGGAPETLCDGDDDRVASNDPAVGRLRGGSCTGYLISSGALLTAGHCRGNTIVEFDVPPSDPDGTINFADPADQYAIGGFLFEARPRPDDPSNTIIGQDWMVFEVAPNTETGLLPGRAQGAFYRISKDHDPTLLRVTGFGADAGTTNRTQQTDTGSNEGETVEDPDWAIWRHRVDTRGGNSGSPISDSNGRLAIAIHTHGGCSADGGSNAGTSFESDDLDGAIADFFGTDVVYLDAGHPATIRVGTPLRPHGDLRTAVAAVPAGGDVRVVTGTYGGSVGVYAKRMAWLAPVGSVVIR